MFRPVQAEGRPTSFVIASDSGSFERGALVFITPNGEATSKEDGNVVLGIADDNYSTTYSTKVIGEVITGSGTTTSASALTVDVYTAHKPISLDGYAIGTDLFNSTSTSLKLEYKLATASEWTSTTDTANWTVKITDATTGGIQISATSGAGLAANTAYNVRLTLNYTFVNTSSLGYTSALDMVGNDTTVASGKVTVYFLPGIYETDQFDPYVAYTPGDAVYAVKQTTSGLITTASASNKQIGIVLKAPSAALDAANQVVYGHENPIPNSLRILMRI